MSNREICPTCEKKVNPDNHNCRIICNFCGKKVNPSNHNCQKKEEKCCNPICENAGYYRISESNSESMLIGFYCPGCVIVELEFQKMKGENVKYVISH